MREFECNLDNEIVIESLCDFEQKLEQEDPKREKYAYRGQGCCIWGISSLLERKIEETEKEKGGPIDHALFELKLIEKYKEESKKDGENDGECLTTYNLLAKMQHYEIPTRLLDVTYDPLTALYFACSSSAGMNGRVIPFSRHCEVEKMELCEILADTAQMIVDNRADLESIHRLYMKMSGLNAQQADINCLNEILQVEVILRSQNYTENQLQQHGTFVLILNAYDKANKIFKNNICNGKSLIYEFKKYNIPFSIIIPACRKLKILDELKSRKYCEETLLPEKDKIEKYAHILEEVKKEAKVL